MELEVTLEEVLALVSFYRDENGDLQINSWLVLSKSFNHQGKLSFTVLSMVHVADNYFGEVRACQMHRPFQGFQRLPCTEKTVNANLERP